MTQIDDGGEDRKRLVVPSDDDDQDMKELIARALEGGMTTDELSGSQTKTTKEQFGVPLIFTYQDDQRIDRYFQGDGAAQLVEGGTPSGATWVETDARMSRKKALKLYGADLLAFERVNRVTTLDVTGMAIRKRVEITIRLLVRNTAKHS